MEIIIIAGTLLTALVIGIVISLYITVKKFNRLKKFRESVAVGDVVQFYYPKHGLWTYRAVSKVGIEYVEVIMASKRVVLHKNDIYPYE